MMDKEIHYQVWQTQDMFCLKTHTCLSFFFLRNLSLYIFQESKLDVAITRREVDSPDE